MKTKTKVLGLVAASALLTTSAFSQITVSGYMETSLMVQERKQANNTAGFESNFRSNINFCGDHNCSSICCGSNRTGEAENTE